MLQDPRALGAELWVLRAEEELAIERSTGQAFGNWEQAHTKVQGPEKSWPVKAVPGLAWKGDSGEW